MRKLWNDERVRQTCNAPERTYVMWDVNRTYLLCRSGGLLRNCARYYYRFVARATGIILARINIAPWVHSLHYMFPMYSVTVVHFCRVHCTLLQSIFSQRCALSSGRQIWTRLNCSLNRNSIYNTVDCTLCAHIHEHYIRTRYIYYV
jgi:ABC-type glucose/galactose transport system permease subunit